MIHKKHLGLSLYQKSIKKLLQQDRTLLGQGIIKEIDNKYILNTKYKIGKILVKKNVAQFIDKDMRKIFIELDKLNGAYNDDLVLIQMIFNPRHKTKAKVIKIIERSDAEILCFIKDSQTYSVKDNIKLTFNISLSSYKNGDILLIAKEKIVSVVGNISDTKIDEKISLYLYKQNFRSQEYITNINDEFKMRDRVDLTNLPFCTIDPASAKDHDDAIYFDSDLNILYVAIADVSAFIKEGSPQDLEARKRAFSIYLPNKVLPMIPFSLSADLCSLKPDIKRFAFVFKIKLDTKKLEVVKSEVFEATIKSQNKYSYEEIDDVIKDKTKGYEDILKLYSLTAQFRKKRLQNGFDFRTEELSLQLDENEELQSVVIETSSPSHKLVEECMLLANCEAAKKLKGLGIFRVHEEPKAKSIEKLIDDVNMLGLNAKLKDNVHKTIESIQSKAANVGLENEVDELIIQSQQQARYGSKSLGHFGLGFKDYSHFTSPIRRYADLVLHRILKTRKIPADIEVICEDISVKERDIASLVWDLEDRKYARWADKNLEKSFAAIIVDAQNGIAKLQEEMIGARVVCKNYAGQRLFSNVKVTLKSSDIITKNIIVNIQD
ncbi:MAG: VacB/RNase II family 3'-5' exoribonuclease [Arcobacteraceae bacterium]|nr:VacB/RNase II family 3'-5' exoribonuclease [Arcobacteraceae bacterium]